MPAAPQLDEIDRRILRELQADGRVSNLKLAERVGLSSTPCWNRVRALQDAGVIEGYTAVLNQRLLGTPDTVLVEIKMARHDDETMDQFDRAVVAFPEVIEAYVLTGEYDYLLKVAVSGAEGYEQFLRKRLYKLPGILHSRSAFTLRCLKRDASAPVGSPR